jgi:uncharacterized protein (DUF58 family)
MEVTRRYWTIAGFGGVLAAAAVLFARPALLAGAAALGAWLLARQYVFIRELDRTTDDLAIDVETSRARTATGDPVPIGCRVSLSRPAALSLAITARPGAVGRAPSEAERTIGIDPGVTSGSIEFEVAWPVAGSFAFEASIVEVTDPHGLFAARLSRECEASITVEPRDLREVHVGAGGDRIATAFGEHDTGRLGSGLDPAELREYLPGDTARQIDWKATARRGYPHVREYEIQADYTTLLLVDRRPAMGRGTAGETPLEYARHVALTVVGAAREFNDPIGLSLVGEGEAISRPPDAGASQYAAIRERLRDLRPSGVGRSFAPGVGPTSASDPAAARRRAALLADDGTALGAVLRPFLSNTGTHIERLADDPLFETARRSIATVRGSSRTVLFTDDTGRAETRETVKLARRDEGEVLVFLTPQVLFEPGELADIERTYERYVEFEEFRRELARLERVSAFEVAPGDRLEGVLAAGRGRRTRGRNPDRDGSNRDDPDRDGPDRTDSDSEDRDPDRDRDAPVSQHERSVIA